MQDTGLERGTMLTVLLDLDSDSDFDELMQLVNAVKLCHDVEEYWEDDGLGEVFFGGFSSRRPVITKGRAFACHAKMSFTTLPLTSVRRKSRPA